MAEEIGSEHHKKLGKKELLIIGGAAASIVALLYLMKRSSGGTQVLNPAPSPAGGASDQTLQATVAAANLQLQQQKLTQDAAIAQANIDLQKVALGTQYNIAALNANSQNARTAMSSFGPGGMTDIGKIIDNLFKKDSSTQPGSSFDAYKAYMQGQAFGDVARLDQNNLYAGNIAQNAGFPASYNTGTYQTAGNINMASWTNTLPYDNAPIQSSEVTYGNTPTGTSDGGGSVFSGGGWGE